MKLLGECPKVEVEAPKKPDPTPPMARIPERGQSKLDSKLDQQLNFFKSRLGFEKQIDELVITCPIVKEGKSLPYADARMFYIMLTAESEYNRRKQAFLDLHQLNNKRVLDLATSDAIQRRAKELERQIPLLTSGHTID